MARGQIPFFALNAGEVSPSALMRLDLDKMKLGCETVENWIPTVLGPAIFRPGTEYIGASRSNLYCKLIPFFASATEKHLLEITNGRMRIWTDDELVTAGSVSTTITNGTFSSSLATGWTDASGTGASASTSGGYLILEGGSFETARVQQTLTISAGDQNDEHFFDIDVTSGPVTFRAGSTSGADDYVTETALGTGKHTLSFTPTGASVYIEFEASQRLTRKVNAISIRSSGTVEVTAPWAFGDLDNLKWAQSADVVFVAAEGMKPYQIERRGSRSWSIVEFVAEKGPWRAENTTSVTLTPGARRGATTLTASRSIFKSTHVGALFRLTQKRQYVQEVLTGPSQATDPIKVTGIGNDRDFVIEVSGTFTGTIQLERSFDEKLTWVKYKTYSATTSGSNDIQDAVGSPAHSSYDKDNPKENNDNRVIYYRFATKSNASWTGSATVYLNYDGGSQVGTCRVTSYTSGTVVDIEVIDTFSTSNPTPLWRESEWSSYRGYPSAVAMFEGRLWWAANDKVWGSASDDFGNYDPDEEGDAGAISRSIGTGPVEGVNWILPLSRLIIGTSLSEAMVRSSSLDEPLTPSNFGIRTPSSRGSSSLSPVAVDGSGIFVQRSGRKVYELNYDGGSADYRSLELTRLNPEVLGDGSVGMAVQRHPDTRVWFVRDDGTLAVLVYEPSDNVVGWCRVDVGGTVESIAVIPNDVADDVYVVVVRTINGSTVRYLEKFRRDDEAEGDTVNWMVDCGISVTPSGTSVTGLSHLEGQQVIVWSSTAAARVGQSSMLTVSSGAITLPASASNAIVGLPYTGTIKTAKLAYASEAGNSALTQRKRVSHLGIVARNIGVGSLRIGKNASKLTALPSVINGNAVAATSVIEEYDQDAPSVDGGWDSDSRVYIEAKAPYPAKILGLVVHMETNDRVI